MEREGEGKDSFTVEKPGEPHLSPVTQVGINRDKSLRQSVPLISCDKSDTSFPTHIILV